MSSEADEEAHKHTQLSKHAVDAIYMLSRWLSISRGRRGLGAWLADLQMPS